MVTTIGNIEPRQSFLYNKSSHQNNYEINKTKMSLNPSDAFCYICRSVLIEPVTVPCSHVFCYSCFEQSMQETSYSCPLCRKRISNWVRTAKKCNRLINTELWKKIKEQFKDQVFSKLRGEDDGLDESLQNECFTPTAISKPGEVAEEFSKLMNDFKSERDKLRQAEEEASRELISRLTEEENQQLEKIRRDNQLISKKDEELARKIQEELNKEIPTSSNDLHNKRQSNKSNNKISKGPMDLFLKGSTNLKLKNGLTCYESALKNRSASADSADSIRSELHHFKPIKVVPRTPPKQYPDGKVVEINVTKVPPLKVSNKSEASGSSSQIVLSSNNKIHSPYSAFIGKAFLPSQGNCSDSSHESPRKRLRFSCDEPESGVLKEITLGENSDSNSMSTSEIDFDESSRRKRSSPIVASLKASNPVKKNAVFVHPSKKAPYSFIDEAEEEEEEEEEGNSTEENENKAFNTQDYLNPDSDSEEKLIEEQKRIEQLILQEKADRELALKLSREWENRYELRKKPKPKPKQKTPVKKKSKVIDSNCKKVQQTLLDNLVTKTKNSSK